ncbi:MAG TPA: hypothetical protein VHG08_12315 [Longimicrobium sp.]|nr:hypothetical protein [Longimicrobium sp.]
MNLEYWKYGQPERHLEDIVNLLYGLNGDVDFDLIERETQKRDLREPWQAACLRWREAVAAKEAAERKRPAG